MTTADREPTASVPEHLLGAGADASPPSVGHAPDSGAASVRTLMVCGSRGWKDTARVLDVIAGYSDGWEIVHGDAAGADQYAAAAAQFLGIPARPFRPLYAKFGRKATHIRNDLMLKNADAVVAFWDGQSRGTASVIEKARKRGIPVEVVS